MINTMRTFQIALGLLVASSATATAQGHDMGAMPGMHHGASTTVSALARKQIDSVAKASLPLGTTAAASAKGFSPAFGWIPTMGTHWVARALMVNGRQTDLAKPSQLMFTKIGGRDSLVGAAFAYLTSTGDTVRPVLFDGAPAWHEHPDLAPAGLTLVMLHVWFVPSPDGPFAGTNPNLPFWAVGLNAPDASRMQDSAFSMRVRRASLALAEVADSTSILSNLERRPAVGRAMAARRDSVRALIPQFKAAEQSGNRAQWDAVAERAAKQWDGMYAAYYDSAVTEDGAFRIKRYVDMLLGQHRE